jgi:hypothetical protein
VKLDSNLYGFLGPLHAICRHGKVVLVWQYLSTTPRIGLGGGDIPQLDNPSDWRYN